MTRKVYKYPLKVTGVQIVTLPEISCILTVQEQNGKPQLWALVKPESTQGKEVEILIVGTGHSLPNEGTFQYISTFQLNGGSLVFHVFQVIR